MERIITLIGALVCAGIVVFIALNFVYNPMHAREKALVAEASRIAPIEVNFEKPNWDFKKWQQSIAAKPALWQQLLAPPAPPPPPPEKPPDLNAMIKDVAVGRQQIGPKVKVMKGGDAKGTFMAVGDTLNGLTIKEITKTEMVLSLTWKGQELTVAIPRK